MNKQTAVLICSCVCIKPDETIAEVKQSHQPSSQDASNPNLNLESAKKLFFFFLESSSCNVTFNRFLFSLSVIRADETVTPQRRQNRTECLFCCSFCSKRAKKKWREMRETRAQKLKYHSHQNPILRDRQGRKEASVFASIKDKKQLFRGDRKRFMSSSVCQLEWLCKRLLPEKYEKKNPTF